MSGSASVTHWIDQLSDGNQQAAEELWQHISTRLQEFARQRLDAQIRRRYDENDAANSAFHSLCRGLADGRMEAENRDALWGLLAVITSRKIAAHLRPPMAKLPVNGTARNGRSNVSWSESAEFGWRRACMMGNPNYGRW